MTTTRKLGILNVEDETPLAEEFGAFFEIIRVRNIADAQEIWREHRRLLRGAPLIDLALIDVNMHKNDKDDHPPEIGLQWITEPTQIAPYGPLLSLPLLRASRFAQFVPFSAYWDQPGVKTNAYLLVSLALILGIIEGRNVTLDEIDHEMTMRTKRRGGGKLDRGSLKVALQDYRQKVLAAAGGSNDESAMARREIRLHDVHDTLKEIEELIEHNVELTMPLSSAEGRLLTLEWTHLDDETPESIEIGSLFADFLDFAHHSPTKSGLRDLCAELSNNWTPLAHGQPLPPASPS